ncbi:hypothetical protein HII12_000773 [Brettanomyces bruxellensis]|uniref:ADF-H domain-containing protein n=1 Tax=Dekkera bruxellensis TaxID=5007 RepID=A0A8H6BPZ2_DEKBR|nr:hypothetical protein HII12_000773 [Brettanomyces bruxellensis]
MSWLQVKFRRSHPAHGNGYREASRIPPVRPFVRPKTPPTRRTALPVPEAASGMGLNPGTKNLLRDFQFFVASQKKVLIVKIQNEALEVDSTLDGGDASIDVWLQSLRSTLSEHAPAYVVIRNNNGKTFTFISYVPSEAKVHDKMVYASTNGAIARDLGADHFSSSVFVDSKEDLTSQWWESVQGEKKGSDSNIHAEEDPEKQDDEIWLQAGSSSRRKSLVQDQRKELGFRMDPSLEKVVYGCAGHSGDVDVVYTIVIKGEELQLDAKHTLENLKTDLVGVLPTENPSYNIVSIRDRMKYAASRLAFTKDLKNHGYNFKQTVEVGDPAELDVSSLLETTSEQKKDTAKASQFLGGKMRFSKPRGPRRR